MHLKHNNTTAIPVAIIEDSQSDVATLREYLERPELWQEMVGEHSWMREYRIHSQWVCDEQVEEQGQVVDKPLALRQALQTGANLLILDINLSKSDERYIAHGLAQITDLQAMQTFWNQLTPENGGGLWILRELHRLRLSGFKVPAVAINSQIGAVNDTHLSKRHFNLNHFLMQHGATWTFRKSNFGASAAKTLLGALALMQASNASQGVDPSLAAMYFEHKGSDNKEKLDWWDKVQSAVLLKLSHILDAEGINSEQAKASMLGLAYNTYVSKIKKSDESNG